jgi:hypothetical protein
MAGEREWGGKYRAFGSIDHARTEESLRSYPRACGCNRVCDSRACLLRAPDLEIARVYLLYSALFVKSTAVELDFTYSGMDDYNYYQKASLKPKQRLNSNVLR